MASKPRPSISVVIPTFNGKKLLQRNLPSVVEALKKADKAGEIIVVDDGSTDNTQNFLRQAYPQIKLLVHSKNQGFGPAIQTGVKKARGKLIYLLNNDVRLKPEALLQLLPHFKDPQVFAVASRQKLALLKSVWGGAPIPRFSYGLLLHQEFSLSQNPTQAFRILYANQGAAMFDRAKFVKLLASQKIYAPTYYWADTEISYRALKRGWKVLCEPKSIVIHLHEATMSRRFSSFWRNILSQRNKLIFTWRNLTSKRLILSHLFWLPWRLLLSLVADQGKFALGFVLALPFLPQIILERLLSPLPTRVSDQEILSLNPPLPPRPKLAILTESIRRDNHAPLRFFKKIEIRHFYHQAPYGDLKPKELKTAVRYRTLWDLWKKLKQFQPDIIQGAEPYGSRVALKISLLAMFFAKKFNCRLIFGVWENRPVEIRFGKLLGKLLRRILTEYARTARLIFAANTGAKKNLLAAGTNPEKIYCLPWGLWGVDRKIFYKRKKIPKTFRGYRDNIFFAGRLDEAKGITYLLEAVEKVAQKRDAVQLVMAGQGPLKQFIREFARRKKIKVKLLGMVKNTDLPPYFSHATLTVYPSVTLRRWEEQAGTVNLQALACGSPLVTTRSGAIPEYLKEGKGAILVPERDSQALARAILKILTNPQLRAKLSREGPRYIQKHFDAQQNVKFLEKFLLEKLRD